MKYPLDPRFTVKVFNATPNPQLTVWGGMHQDYSEEYLMDEEDKFPSETKAGQICVNRLLAGERGHYGPLEHAHIVFAAGWFPHSVMQQARTHRIAVSFDVQSFRYTSQRIVDVAIGSKQVEEVFYLRPVGSYSDREGAKYEYTEDLRKIDVARAYDAAAHYTYQIRNGMAEEQARGMLPFDTRQHFLVSFAMRSLMHFLDLRSKADAQLEIRQLCDLMWPHFVEWAPEIAGWYEEKRLHRARLAP